MVHIIYLGLSRQRKVDRSFYTPVGNQIDGLFLSVRACMMDHLIDRPSRTCTKFFLDRTYTNLMAS
jgi:hypothetical protein